MRLVACLFLFSLTFVSPLNPGQISLSRLRQGYVTNDGKGYIAYVGEIGVGMPPQNFTVAFDVGSQGLILMDSKCKTADCNAKRRFDSSASSTYTPIDVVKTEFIRSTVSANQSKELLHFGATSLQNVFIAVTEQPPRLYSTVPYDGVFGLRFSTSSRPFFPLKEHDDVKLSLYVERSKNEKVELEENIGTATIGGLDSRCEQPTYFDTIYGDWYMNVQTAYIGSSQYGWSAFGYFFTQIDLSIDYISIPQRGYDQVTKFYQDHYALKTVAGNKQYVKCDFHTYITFKLHTSPTALQIHTRYLHEPVNAKGLEGYCTLKLRVIEKNDPNQIRIGSVLLNDHCVTFDGQGRTSFSRKKETV